MSNPDSLLPLPPATFHILVALADDDRHGYAIIQDIAARTDGALRLGAGTLYRSIHRMLEQGLVVETHTPLVPMVIYDAWERVRPDSLIVNPGEITVVIHPERDTSDWTIDNLREKANALHAEYELWLAEGPPPR